MDIKKILCAYHDSDHVVYYGMSLARAFGAKLHVCHIIDLSYAPLYSECLESAELDHRISDDIQRRIQRLIAAQPIEWEMEIRKGSPAFEIVTSAEEGRADLVIVATRAGTGIKWPVLGSVAEHLIRTLSCPVLVLRIPDSKSEGPPYDVGFKRILVGSDFSTHSCLALDYGASIAKKYGSELHLVHSIEHTVHEYAEEPSVKQDDEPFDHLKMRINEKLNTMIAERSFQASLARTEVLTGHAYDQICSYAIREEIDLIVLGTHGHRLLDKLLIGSTTDRVTRKAMCPVMAVPPRALTAFEKAKQNAGNLLEGKMILIVDDEPDVLETLEELLSESEVSKATSFEKAKALLEGEHFDLAVLDIMGVDGYGLLEIANKKGVTAIMLTAHALSPEDIMDSYDKGAAFYIPKDKISDIVAFLNDVLEAKKEGKHPWWRWSKRFDSYLADRFGPEWQKEHKGFWKKLYSMLR